MSRYDASGGYVFVVESEDKGSVGIRMKPSTAVAFGLNQIEELKERVEKRLGPARPESEELRLCRAQLSALRDASACCWTVLGNDGFVRQGGETLPQALSRYVNGAGLLRSTIREERLSLGELRGDVMKALADHGIAEKEGENIVDAVKRALDVKDIAITGMRRRAQELCTRLADAQWDLEP